MQKVFIISGASWSWKTTIYENFMKKNPNKLEKIITITTRKKRKTEIDKRDYYFVSVEKFKSMIDKHELIEYAEVYGNFYGSSFQELDEILEKWKTPLYIVDPQGVKNLKERLSWKYNISTIFILAPSVEELKRRLIRRWEDPESEQFKTRIRESIACIEEKHIYDFCIKNENLEHALRDLEKIIN